MKNLRSLAEIQLALQNSIKQQSMPSTLAQIILETPQLPPQDRLQIYHKGYSLRLLHSLSEDFPRLEENLGPAEFTRLASQYIAQQPSKSRNLAEYSEQFPSFLASISQPQRHITLAIEDWMILIAIHAPDPEPTALVSTEEFARGQDFKIQTHPATGLRKIVGETPSSADSARLAFRQQGMAQIISISEDDFALISFCQTAKSLDELNDKARVLGLASEDLSQKLYQWFKNEVLVPVHSPRNGTI